MSAAVGCQGTVKWFSNKKGFGFIAPTSDNTPTQEEIFVHQTGIVSDGQFRTLQENSEVKFDVEKEDESGKLKAVNVTNVDGTPISPPARQPRRPRGQKNKKEGEAEASAEVAETPDEPAEGTSGDEAKENVDKGDTPGKKGKGRNGRGARSNNGKKKAEGAANGEVTKEASSATPAPPKEPPFHAKFSEEIKSQINEKGLQLGNKTTIDVALGEATRIKLGQGGYAGLALASAVIGEGKYDCTELGLVRFTWERSLKFDGGEWKTEDPADLLNTFSLLDVSVGPVKPDETAATLWGEDKPDPKEAFEANGFQMRRVVLTRPPNRFGGRGGRSGGGRRNNKKQETPAAASASIE
mmetsp:Transcript_22128/g.28629  ORF Transcript_22128/g.28629 Transcript_22128/m.28629 type:complete len:354 (-) Transcript_22128:212-1273(-)|eukprot:CAMPEP_0198138386 /NCGR_PEP_ID=MMETSP1443-20131203/1797_1 /TAXON_ID=186043 /ORGANISM="Entomoneis sp., Strain CCMP2396" /LENGTH=353 /DNA_ID=CAMNT_0043800141 /DNA_START=35 /DNA_END=1096 /DNA_ORIENTATION=+